MVSSVQRCYNFDLQKTTYYLTCLGLKQTNKPNTATLIRRNYLHLYFSCNDMLRCLLQNKADRSSYQVDRVKTHGGEA